MRYYRLIGFTMLPAIALLTGCISLSGPPPVPSAKVPAAASSVPIRRALGTTPNQLTLSWTDASPNETEFRVDRCCSLAVSCQPSSTVAALPANTMGYVDTGLVAGQTCCYAVQARNATQTSPFSNVACGTVAGIVVPAPPITVAPATVAFAYVQGGALPPALTVAVMAQAGQAWVTVDTMPFANVTPATGTVPSPSGVTGTGPGSFILTPSNGMSSLPIGQSAGVITVSSAGQPDVLIPVTVTVTSVAPPPPLPAPVLQITKSGSGAGTVISLPPGIQCSSVSSGTVTSGTCVAAFAEGTAVTLVAIPTSNKPFGGWSGVSCPGFGPCTLTLTGPMSVAARFQ